MGVFEIVAGWYLPTGRRPHEAKECEHFKRILLDLFECPVFHPKNIQSLNYVLIQRYHAFSAL